MSETKFIEKWTLKPTSDDVSNILEKLGLFSEFNHNSDMYKKAIELGLLEYYEPKFSEEFRQSMLNEGEWMKIDDYRVPFLKGKFAVMIAGGVWDMFDCMDDRIPDGFNYDFIGHKLEPGTKVEFIAK